MAIGLIIVKDIPRNCYECNNHNYHFCSWTGDSIEEYMECSNRPNSCPIKEMPEKMKYHNGTYNGQVKGWNLCLDTILNNQ